MRERLDTQNIFRAHRCGGCGTEGQTGFHPNRGSQPGRAPGGGALPLFGARRGIRGSGFRFARRPLKGRFAPWAHWLRSCAGQQRSRRAGMLPMQRTAHPGRGTDGNLSCDADEHEAAARAAAFSFRGDSLVDDAALHSARDRHDLTGDVPRELVRGEDDDLAGDVVRLSDLAQRHRAGDPADGLGIDVATCH